MDSGTNTLGLGPDSAIAHQANCETVTQDAKHWLLRCVLNSATM